MEGKIVRFNTPRHVTRVLYKQKYDPFWSGFIFGVCSMSLVLVEEILFLLS